MPVNSTIDIFVVLLFGLLYVGGIAVKLYFIIKKAVKDALMEMKNEEGA